MKDHKRPSKISNLSSLLRETFERTKMVSLKNTKVFLTFLGKLSWRVVLLSTLVSLKGTRNRVKMIHNFGRYLVTLNQRHGPDYVIAYLKASQLALSKFLAKQPLGSLKEVNPDYPFPRLAHGIPVIIGPRDRAGLRNNNRKVIILWMSIFGIFRVLAGTYSLKLSTITNPFSGNFSFLEEKTLFMSSFTRDKLSALPWARSNSKRGLSALNASRLLLFSTSSPSSKVSWKGLIVDVRNLTLHGLDKAMVEWMTITESVLLRHFVLIRDEVLKLIPEIGLKQSDKVVYWESNGRIECDPWRGPFSTASSSDFSHIRFISTPLTPYEIERASYPVLSWLNLHKNEGAVDNIGQLQFVQEPAGKLRVFAMVDVWTQSIMQPVHKLLTSILRSLPNDGTLNQEASYKRAREKSLQFGKSFGYDLSAATDRLPIALQVSILRGVFLATGVSPELANRLSLLWKEILVSRPFYVPKVPKGTLDPQDMVGKQVFYEVGQPMGALSSFNMLAITHHMIMQDIAHSCGVTPVNIWCDLYEITGDDIVIFDDSLAGAYVQYMDLLGLELNQKKSVVSVSKAAGEYLKKTWIQDIDVSQISWKQLYQNHSTLMGRVSDALYFIKKWGSAGISIPSIVRKASLSWDSLSTDSSRKVLTIPYLALLSTAIRQAKLPLEDFFLFFLREGMKSFRFTDLYRLNSLSIDQKEVIQFLESLRTDGITIPNDTLWNRKRMALNDPIRGIKLAIKKKIISLQEKIHGKAEHFKVTLRSITGPPKMIDSGTVKVERPYGTEWSQKQINLMIEAVSGSSLNPDIRLYLHDLFSECVLRPALIYQYGVVMERNIKRCWAAAPWFKLEQLDSLSLTALLDIMNAQVSLESLLTSHLVEDDDRRVAHKVSLSVLRTLKPAPIDGEPTTVKTLPLSRMWKSLPGKMRGFAALGGKVVSAPSVVINPDGTITRIGPKKPIDLE